MRTKEEIEFKIFLLSQKIHNLLEEINSNISLEEKTILQTVVNNHRMRVHILKWVLSNEN